MFGGWMTFTAPELLVLGAKLKRVPDFPRRAEGSEGFHGGHSRMDGNHRDHSIWIKYIPRGVL